MLTKTQERALASLTLLGAGLVLLTRLVRPGLTNALEGIVFLFGVLPNFGAGLGVPATITLLASWFLQRRQRHFQPKRLFVLASTIGLAGVTAWEFTGGTIDAFDLLATLAGVLISLVCGGLALAARKPKLEES